MNNFETAAGEGNVAEHMEVYESISTLQGRIKLLESEVEELEDEIAGLEINLDSANKSLQRDRECLRAAVRKCATEVAG